ncbi:hypothetical protein A3D05_01920 [Candidatus Gottesmanbacteria bacterium RIFCSPHIGHO2_02_FULL_40_24]|uniref:EfeO-type cupredoxin-like domain-containing protein n=1 Tax=Candidatus Gottesmanbacteria bacterium RIFCSPHIGHO2_01_FULL_40_15 TaxID=1798376 RepID=A0A1F5Z4M8_9BACT|nr:MAG: hypothetical protein A2777_04315 [Candidatus Gottesmanbacteria bacterium RIFCSPHIGHO2_01_FULL_40_15]OGG18613.1 MAG: hypothetical protein A3D05_01920 [Candidatus Gottesmanbacteria bacterium RIFCSPHIGHO2_02_FULL_40_24]OGG22838.1 MAG: hypothetical protein A3B48_05630 [Candidatus Gottesmanbacteria bacterium RIFCSPLOWO2_01_FULL_40_10]OGG24927.1 MAG: hypothetical protein A3E42_02740 [Candidatus Gottesmanbacteria bacterium RIFCSPHIGHO2_12_FULL_40_13]OGG31730.1 MAG: hypothetical protein A3I80_0
MTPDQIIILLSGTLGIIFTYWFFFAGKDTVLEAAGPKVNIKVDGGYKPSVIKLIKDKPVELSILRSDPSDCLEEIVLPVWNIKKFLPLNKEINIKINPDKKGIFPFHCGMNMFHGKIIVED